MLRTGIRRLLPLALLGASLLCAQASFGAGRSTQMEKNRREHQQIYSIIKEIKNKNRQLGSVVQELDHRTRRKQDEISDLKKQLKQAEAKQAQYEEDRQQASRDLSSYQELLGKRARQVYMEGDLTYVDLLFQASSMSDFIDRVYFVQAILEQDNALIEKTQAAQEQIEVASAALAQQIESIKAIKEKLDSQLGEMEQILSDKKELIQENDNDIELYEKRANELEEANKRLAAIARQSSGYTGKWSGSFMKPVPGPITSGFGYRNHPIFHRRKRHTGVDIGAPEGTPIHPGGKGKVIYAEWMNGYGNCIMIDHGGGRSTLYGHLSAIKCAVGDIVTTDSVIGRVGSTGYSTGNHLHFEVRINGEPVDPLGSIQNAGPVSRTSSQDD
jgi:murein DD-endopeptidase MepM/ murein hydrolase activator NlpD